MDELPNEVLLQICSYLSATSLARLLPVARFCYEVAVDERLWQRLYYLKYPQFLWQFLNPADEAALKVPRDASYRKAFAHLQLQCGQYRESHNSLHAVVSPITKIPIASVLRTEIDNETYIIAIDVAWNVFGWLANNPSHKFVITAQTDAISLQIHANLCAWMTPSRVVVTALNSRTRAQVVEEYVLPQSAPATRKAFVDFSRDYVVASCIEWRQVYVYQRSAIASRSEKSILALNIDWDCIALVQPTVSQPELRIVHYNADLHNISETTLLHNTTSTEQLVLNPMQHSVLPTACIIKKCGSMLFLYTNSMLLTYDLVSGASESTSKPALSTYCDAHKVISIDASGLMSIRVNTKLTRQNLFFFSSDVNRYDVGYIDTRGAIVYNSSNNKLTYSEFEGDISLQIKSAISATGTLLIPVTQMYLDGVVYIMNYIYRALYHLFTHIPPADRIAAFYEDLANRVKHIETYQRNFQVKAVFKYTTHLAEACSYYDAIVLPILAQLDYLKECPAQDLQGTLLALLSSTEALKYENLNAIPRAIAECCYARLSALIVDFTEQVKVQCVLLADYTGPLNIAFTQAAQLTNTTAALRTNIQQLVECLQVTKCCNGPDWDSLELEIKSVLDVLERHCSEVETRNAQELIEQFPESSTLPLGKALDGIIRTTIYSSRRATKWLEPDTIKELKAINRRLQEGAFNNVVSDLASAEKLSSRKWESLSTKILVDIAAIFAAWNGLESYQTSLKATYPVHHRALEIIQEDIRLQTRSIPNMTFIELVQNRDNLAQASMALETYPLLLDQNLQRRLHISQEIADRLAEADRTLNHYEQTYIRAKETYASVKWETLDSESIFQLLLAHLPDLNNLWKLKGKLTAYTAEDSRLSQRASILEANMQNLLSTHVHHIVSTTNDGLAAFDPFLRHLQMKIHDISATAYCRTLQNALAVSAQRLLTASLDIELSKEEAHAIINNETSGQEGEVLWKYIKPLETERAKLAQWAKLDISTKDTLLNQVYAHMESLLKPLYFLQRILAEKRYTELQIAPESLAQLWVSGAFTPSDYMYKSRLAYVRSDLAKEIAMCKALRDTDARLIKQLLELASKKLSEVSAVIDERVLELLVYARTTLRDNENDYVTLAAVQAFMHTENWQLLLAPNQSKIAQECSELREVVHAVEAKKNEHHRNAIIKRFVALAQGPFVELSYYEQKQELLDLKQAGIRDAQDVECVTLLPTKHKQRKHELLENAFTELGYSTAPYEIEREMAAYSLYSMLIDGLAALCNSAKLDTEETARYLLLNDARDYAQARILGRVFGNNIADALLPVSQAKMIEYIEGILKDLRRFQESELVDFKMHRDKKLGKADIRAKLDACSVLKHSLANFKREPMHATWISRIDGVCKALVQAIESHDQRQVDPSLCKDDDYEFDADEYGYPEIGDEDEIEDENVSSDEYDIGDDDDEDEDVDEDED